MADINIGKFINNLDREDLSSEDLQGVVNNVYAKAISDHKKADKQVKDNFKEKDKETVEFIKANHDRLKAHKNKPEKDIDKDDATAKDKVAKEINEAVSPKSALDEAGGHYTLYTGKRKSQKGKFNDSTTFEQWYDATFDSPSYRNSEYYPFNNYVKIFSNAESLRNATADDIVKNAHRFYDVYDVDSADREYAFNFARDVTGIDYDDLYNAWSSGEPLTESKKLEESEDEFEVAKYKGNQYGIWSKSSKNWMTFGKKADLEKRVKELNAKKSYKECTKESLKEDWTIFEFTSGSNPYIAKTDKEVKRLLRKYKNKVKKINDTHYEIDDRTDNKFDLFPVRESKKLIEAEDGNMTIEPGDFYKVAIKELPAEDIDHHESDLYIRKTPKSTELIKKLTTDSLLSTFRDQIDNDIWYELPFCYDPFWQSKNNIEEGRSIPRNATKIKVGGKEFTKDGDWVDDSRVHVSPRDIKRFYGDDVEVLETDPNYKSKRTKEVKVLQGNYGYGWDDLVEYEKEDYAELKQDLKSYRENEKGASFRVVTRRIPLGESRKLKESDGITLAQETFLNEIENELKNINESIQSIINNYEKLSKTISFIDVMSNRFNFSKDIVDGINSLIFIDSFLNLEAEHREKIKSAYKRIFKKDINESLKESIKERYKDTRKQAAYENACDCIIYGYGKSYWNSLDLNDEEKKEVWKQAYNDLAEMESFKKRKSLKESQSQELEKIFKELNADYGVDVDAKLSEYTNGDYNLWVKTFYTEAGWKKFEKWLNKQGIFDKSTH